MSYGVLIAFSGSNDAGTPITLECRVSGTSRNYSANFQWFKGPSNNMTQITDDDFITLRTNTSTSQLYIASLRVSHARTYTCQATLQSIVVEGAETVNVNRKCTIHIPH